MRLTDDNFGLELESRYCDDFAPVIASCCPVTVIHFQNTTIETNLQGSNVHKVVCNVSHIIEVYTEFNIVPRPKTGKIYSSHIRVGKF